MHSPANVISSCSLSAAVSYQQQQLHHAEDEAYSSIQSASGISYNPALHDPFGVTATTILGESNIFNLNSYKVAGIQATTSTKVTLEEAEHMCGYQLLMHAGNLTKIIQTMKELRKQRNKEAKLQQELAQKKLKRQSSAGKLVKYGKNTNNKNEKLLQQKRDLLARYEQNRARYQRKENMKDQFRAFLFSNMRTMAQLNKKQNGCREPSLEGNMFDVTPSNLNQLYFDVIEEKNFSQIKTDLFLSTIRKQIDGFLRFRADLIRKLEGKRVSLKIQSDLNQNLKRKYIKKCLDFKRVCKGGEVQEPSNFIEQMIIDLKRNVEEKKAEQEIIQFQQKSKEEEEAKQVQERSSLITSQQQQQSEHPHLSQSIQMQATLQAASATSASIRQRMDQLEVKTISERSHEEDTTNSVISSTANTPFNNNSGHPHNHHSITQHDDVVNGGHNVHEYQMNEGDENYNAGAGVGGGARNPQSKKQIQILDLLNEICEEDDNQLNSFIKPKEDDLSANEISETEKEEDRLIDKIMRIIQTKESDSEQYQSLTYTDGIYLQNIKGEQLEQIIQYLYHLDNPEEQTDLVIPKTFFEQVELFETAEYLGLDDLKQRIVCEGMMKNYEFLKYTNVRRHYLDNLNEEQLQFIFESFDPNLLLFTLTDPSMEQITSTCFEQECKYLFEQFYAQFQSKRIQNLEKMKDDDQYRFIFDEDLMYLTKEYYDVYSETMDNLKMSETISKHICDYIQFLRNEFKALSFDFHSCFYYEEGKFHLHRKYALQEDDSFDDPLVNFKRPLILFSAIQCIAFAESCLSHVFSLSKRFSSIRVLNLRGLVDLPKDILLNQIIKICDQISHLNLSFIQSVDDEVIEHVGIRFNKSLLSLELRSCAGLTDAGIVLMCEALSGIREKRNGEEPTDDYSRYKFFNRHETTSVLKYLNLADLKQLTNKTMKSVAFNLFPGLFELSIWGCYRITNEGFLELCTAYRSDNFRRVNYCGCYKIGDDSRLWISTSFQRVIIYNKVDDFGKGIDYNETVEGVTSSLQKDE